MERWEYQVIHLNVEPPAPAPPAEPPAAPPGVEAAPGAPPIRVEAVFSKEYLEKEFPGFYGSPPPAGTSARDHPANQLRGFLNLQGRDGWQLVGFYPVGQLTMMVFRRPLITAPADGEPLTASPAPPPGDPGLVEATRRDREAESGAPGASPDRHGAALERILQRLEALERRLPPPPPPPQVVARAASQPVALAGLAALGDGEILPSHSWGALDALPRLSTPEAARALGFRSAASLLNLAARSGYPRGLVKRGADAALAIYMGSEKSGRGGRDRRLWVVLRAPEA